MSRVAAAAFVAASLLVLSSCGNNEVPGLRQQSAETPSASAPSSPPTSSASAADDSRDAKQVLSDLADAIDSVKLVKSYTEDDDPNKLLGRPNGYTSKVAFSDSRISKKDTEYADKDAIERGGSVEVYPDAEGAQRRKDYIQTISKETGLASEYDYLKGGILVRVTGNLPPTKAKEYERALG